MTNEQLIQEFFEMKRSGNVVHQMWADELYSTLLGKLNELDELRRLNEVQRSEIEIMEVGFGNDYY